MSRCKIQILTKEEANIAQFKGIIGQLNERIDNLKEEIDDLNRKIKGLNRQIAINTKNNQLRLNNITTVSQQLASFPILLEEESLNYMIQMNTVLSKDLQNAKRIKNQNSEIRAQISENEGLLICKKQLLICKKQLLAETEQQLCIQLIKKAKKDIAAFKIGIGNPIIQLLTDETYKKPPSDPEDACELPIWIIEYRKKVIRLLGPLIASIHIDSHNEHSCNSFNSTFCNGLQGAKQDMESIVNTISEIVNSFGNDNGIMTNLHINTRYTNEVFLNSLFELLDHAENINNYHLDNINLEEFSNHMDSRWNTTRYFDEGDYEYSYSYIDRIKKTFDSALLLLAEFSKIETISESRQEILTFTAAIRVNNAAAITKCSSKLFKSCASTSSQSTGCMWKMHICSFLGHNKKKTSPEEDNS